MANINNFLIRMTLPIMLWSDSGIGNPIGKIGTPIVLDREHGVSLPLEIMQNE